MILFRPGLLSYQLLVELIFLNTMSYLPQIPYSCLTKFTDTENTIYEYGVLSSLSTFSASVQGLPANGVSGFST